MPTPLSIDDIKERIKLKFPHEDLDLSNMVINGTYVENIICNKCKSVIRKIKSNINKAENICNNCLQLTRYTPKNIIVEKLKIHNFELIGEYKGSKHPSVIKCLKCNSIFNKCIRGILRRGDKCIECSKITNEIIDDRIKDRKIKRLGEYINSINLILWECNICEYKWKASTNNILKGKGCPRCAKVIPLNNEIIDERIKDRKFKRLGEYVNSVTKIEWECFKCKNKWMAHSNNILMGKGCPRCRMSKGELKIESFLKINNIKYTIEKSFDDCYRVLSNNKFEFDFYLEDYNLCIEFQGIQHYEPVSYFGGVKGFNKNCERDKFKKDYCISHNINLLEISYLDFNNIETILKTALHL